MTGFQFDLLHKATGGTMRPGEVVAGCSYGNDTIALIQWLVENDYQHVTCLYNDTGWSMPAAAGVDEAWLDRVARMEEWVRSLGFRCDRTESMGMEALVHWKQGWPRQGIQFCTEHLKILPSIAGLAENDPEGGALCMNGKRRVESADRANTPEWVDVSIPHGYRMLRQPLYAHDNEMRDALILRAGHAVLPHKSRECACINSGAREIRGWADETIETIERIEKSLGRSRVTSKPKTMFRPARKKGATGIRQVLDWAVTPRGKYRSLDDGTGPSESATGCDGGFCLS